MSDAVKVQVVFTIPATDTLPSYTDALYFTEAEYAALASEDLEAQKQARYLVWVDAVTNPPAPEPEPTVDPLAHAASLAAQAADLAQQAVAIVQAQQGGN